MDEFKLVGVMLGEYEGNKWARLILLKPLDYRRGVGYQVVDKERSKCEYNLATTIMADWALYENQKVNCSANLYGRINKCELVS